MSERPVQMFSPDYLKRCKKLPPEGILRFLEDFRLLHGGTRPSTKSRLISIKVPEFLLSAFRRKAELAGIRYQSQIKRLMTQWLETESSPNDSLL